MKGAFWSLTGSVISRGLMLIASIIVARILGKTEYGELGMIRSTVSTFVVFAGFGLGLTATKYIAEYKEKDKIKTGKIIGLSTIFAGMSGGLIALVVLLLAPYIANNTINAPHLVNEIRLGAFMLFFSSLNGSQTGVLAGYESFKAIAKVNLIAGLIAFPLQIIFALIWKLPGAVIGYGTNYLLLWFLNIIAIKKESKKNEINIDYLNSWNEWHVLYRFSLPALFSGILVSPVMWICNTILVNQPNGYSELAIFDAANQWRTLILFIPGTISQIALPMLSQQINDKMMYDRILKINIVINFSLSMFFAIFISLLSPMLMNLYGDSFKTGFTTLILLSASSVLVSVNNIIGKAIASKNKMWIGFWFNFIWALVQLLTSYILIKNGFASVGLAFAFVVSYIIHTIIQIVYLKYILKN